MLLDQIAEIFGNSLVAEHHCFTKEGAHLGAADVKYIAQPGKVRKGHIVPLCGQAVAQPGAVQKQVQALFTADCGQLFQLHQAVQSAVLRGIGDVDQLGLSLVLKAVGSPVGVHHGAHLLRRDLAVVGGNGQHLMPGRFHRAGFVDVDMGGIRAQSCLMRPQGSVNHRQIGLSASNQKMHIQLGIAAGGADLICGGFAVIVGAIAGRLLQIGADQRLQDLFVAAFAVIIVKINHGIFLRFVFVFILSPCISSVKFAYGFPEHTASEGSA